MGGFLIKVYNKYLSYEFLEITMNSFSSWLESLDPNELERGTYGIQRERLDFSKLKNRAIRITHPGAGTADPTEVEYNDDKWSFSVVTPYNRVAWENWQTKPISEKYVSETDFLNGKQGNGKPNLDDAKYQQIVMTAKKLGLM